METKLSSFQAQRACVGILRLGKRYGTTRLEKAAERALCLGSCSYKSIESILERKLDQQSLSCTQTSVLPKIIHENIRGAQYYQ